MTFDRDYGGLLYREKSLTSVGVGGLFNVLGSFWRESQQKLPKKKPVSTYDVQKGTWSSKTLPSKGPG
jgi:hypothetical protein